MTAQLLERRRIGPLRVMAYYVAFLVISLAVMFAIVGNTSPTPVRIAVVAFGIAIGAVLVLLVHQPFGPLALLAASLVPLAFVVPGMAIHETPSPCHHQLGTPCDPGMDLHQGLRVAVFAVFLGGSLVAALAGRARSRSRVG